MLKFTTQRVTRSQRHQVRALEALEAREVLTYTALGAALPDLVVTGGVPSLGAYGGSITVAADVSNLSHSAALEPLALAPGSTSSADAGPSTVGVYLSPVARGNWARRSYKLGDIQVPTVLQNSTLNLYQSFDMPSTRPAGFPTEGGNLYVYFRANDSGAVKEVDTTNNVSRGPQAVQVFANLPQLALVTATYPPGLAPGASLVPQFQLGNYGTAPASSVQVELVASSDRYFHKNTSQVLATYTFSTVPALATAPSFGQTVIQDVNLDQPSNVVNSKNAAIFNATNAVSTSQIVTLPKLGRTYYVGYVVDPNHQVKQISDLSVPRSNLLQAVRAVNWPIHGMPVQNQILSSTPLARTFPQAAFGAITSPFIPTVSSDWPATSTSTASSSATSGNASTMDSTSAAYVAPTGGTGVGSGSSGTTSPGSTTTGSSSNTQTTGETRPSTPARYGVRVPTMPRIGRG